MGNISSLAVSSVPPKEEKKSSDERWKSRHDSTARRLTAKAILLLVSAVLMVDNKSVQAFSPLALPSQRFTTMLPAAARSAANHDVPTTKRKRTSLKKKATVAAPQPVQPKTLVSESKLRKAKLAMKEQQQKVDAQMLQLLSEQFLYAENASATRPRPRGRPACVPGAMNYETVLQYRKKQQEMAALLKQNGHSISTTVPYSTAGTPPLVKEEKEEEQQEEDPSEVKRGRGRPRKNTTANGATTVPTQQQKKASKRVVAAQKPSVRNKLTKGSRKKTQTAKKLVMAAVEKKAAAKKKKKKKQRVVKNLPKPRAGQKAFEEEEKMSVTANADPLNLQRYYRTELLNAKEEYSLGMKIHFMTECEHVHEGLAMNMGRLPTIVEWAEACGFDTPDPEFRPTEGDEQIRPAGSESMFEPVDPNTFVGNGLATNAGPGRGRGRVKKPPPLQLGDFYDDADLRFVEKNGKFITKKVPKSQLGPINRGTPLDFVEKMMDSKQAKQRMVQCNMRLVVSIARKYSNVGVNLQDLVQEGSLGLTRAAEKFEPAKGFKFSTYASWWIQQAVFRSIAYHSRTIRLPVHVHNLLNRVRRVKMSLEQDLGRAPTNEEIAEQLDMTVQKYNKMLSLTRRSISLEVPKYQSNPKDFGHESEDLLGETIDSSAVIMDESSPEKRVDRGLFQEDLREMLKMLEVDERRVIAARYGLDDGLTRTVTAVAAQMKQSKAWVRSQECRALRKLRRPWYEKRLKEHQNSLIS